MAEKGKHTSPLVWMLLGVILGFLLSPVKKGYHVSVRVNNGTDLPTRSGEKKGSTNLSGGKQK